MGNPYAFNLLAIAGALSRRWRFIFLIALACGIAGLAGALLRTRAYEAKAEFFLKNPFYADRNFVYNSDARYIDYFGSEDDINRLIVLIHSDTVQNQIIRDLGIAVAYKTDTTNAKELSSFKKNFADRLNLWRTENRSVMLSYVDKDAQRAAQAANLAIKLLEQSLQRFYTDTRAALYQSVLRKIREEERTIAILTDSLVQMRELYGIYDIISPSRYNLMLSSMKNNGKPGFAKGVEQIQNIESMKDEMVSVRAHNLSLAEQYATGTQSNEMPLIYPIKAALPPTRAQGIGALMTALIAAVCGAFFCCIFILITGYYRGLQNSAAQG